MKKVLAFFVLPALILPLLSLTIGRGFWKVEKSESFLHKKADLKNKNIAFLPPEVLSISITDEVDRNYKGRKKLSETVRRNFKWAWKKHRINASFIDENNEAVSFEVFQRLIALRKEIILANNLQNHPLDAVQLNNRGITQSVFVNTPRIDFGYGDLSATMGTPYFALSGFLNYHLNPKSMAMRNYMSNRDISGYGDKHYYYCIIVNVESGEIIYREFKKLPLKLNALNMKHFLHESYAILHKNLKS